MSQKVENLKQLSAEDSNLLYALKDVQERYNDFEIVGEGNYYPYNEIYEDKSWGCAWRAIQTLLSVQRICTDFKDLLGRYFSKKSLLEIVKEKEKRLTIEELEKEKWSPEENESCWAEPLIGYLITKDHDLNSQIILVNGYPKAYAPEFVFSNCLPFINFWELVKQIIPFSSIMIDDGLYCLSIIGYKEGINEEKHLIIADPHIISNRDRKSEGIYEVVLDKFGKQLSTDVDSADLIEKGIHKKIDFENKSWMICYLEKND